MTTANVHTGNSFREGGRIQGIAPTSALPKYAFNAKELDEETGMYYYEARYYAPPVFTSRDPHFERYFWMTPYGYCNNNPLKYVDPTGMDNVIFFPQGGKHAKENQRLKKYAQGFNGNPNIVNVFAHGVESTSAEDFFMGNRGDFLGLNLPASKDLSNYSENDVKTPSEMYGFLMSNSDVFCSNEKENKGSVIVLHSCSSGRGDDSFAKQMSQLDEFKNAVIIAPSDNVKFSPQGKEYVANNGQWNVFYGGKKIASVNGKVNMEKLQNMLSSQNDVQQYIKRCQQYENQ